MCIPLAFSDIFPNSLVVTKAQIYKEDPRTCAIFILAWGSNWGSLGFSCNNPGSSGVYATCIFCGLSMKINMHKLSHGVQRSCRIFFAFVFVCVVGKNLKTTNLSFTADDIITQGSIQGLGSPLYIYGAKRIVARVLHKSLDIKHDKRENTTTSQIQKLHILIESPLTLSILIN